MSLDLSVKLTFFLHTVVQAQQKVIDSHNNTNAHQQTNVVPSVEGIDVYHSFLTQSLPREPNKYCLSAIFSFKSVPINHVFQYFGMQKMERFIISSQINIEISPCLICRP